MIRLKVIFHDGQIDYTEVAEYDAQTFADKLNDDAVAQVAIGDIVTHRTSVARIAKAEEGEV